MFRDEQPTNNRRTATVTRIVQRRAVYLSGVCADSPPVLRGCAQGETGIMLSRYDGINGYDWAAIPQGNRSLTTMPSSGQEGIGLFADAKMVTFLRDRYRWQHLRGIASDKADGGIPVRNWYELVGSSSDRASLRLRN